jgi:hypothetical protein
VRWSLRYADPQEVDLVRILNRPVRIWQTMLVAAALAALAATGTTIAAQDPTARDTIRRASFNVPPNSTVIKRVVCPRRDKALGGGIQVQNANLQDVRDSYPWVDVNDDVPGADDGWEGHVRNSGDETLSDHQRDLRLSAAS